MKKEFFFVYEKALENRQFLNTIDMLCLADESFYGGGLFRPTFYVKTISEEGVQISGLVPGTSRNISMFDS